MISPSSPRSRFGVWKKTVETTRTLLCASSTYLGATSLASDVIAHFCTLRAQVLPTSQNASDGRHGPDHPHGCDQLGDTLDLHLGDYVCWENLVCEFHRTLSVVVRAVRSWAEIASWPCETCPHHRRFTLSVVIKGVTWNYRRHTNHTCFVSKPEVIPDGTAT